MKFDTSIKKIIFGKTSQLSFYYPNDVIKITARKEIEDSIYSQQWDKVYIFFAEQRTSLANKKEYKEQFYKINVKLTEDIINKIDCKNIIFLSTSELWNLYEGPISINTPWNYKENYYTDSKRIITDKLMNDERVTVFFPFNYNSIYRKDTFLFHKIFDSIINKTKISVGNLDMDRELLHASFVQKEIERKTKHDLIGCGQPINIRSFILELYKRSGLDYYDFVEEDKSLPNLVKPFYCSEITPYSLEQRLREYIYDIQNTISQRYNR